jgi:hypothetical protein
LLAANLVTNGSFEGGSSTTGWTNDGASATVAQSSLQKYVGNNSMLVTTPATANRGAKYNLTTTTLATNTKYTFIVSARTGTTTSATTSSMSTFEMGRAEDGSTETSCLTAQTINSTGWTTLTCTFTTGATSGTPYVYVKQTDATARTFFIDGVQLSRTSLVSNYSIEQAIAGNWAIKGAAAVTQDATQFYDGTKSLKIVTTTAAGDGAKQSITLNDSTTYTLSFYGISTGTAISTMEAGYSSDGTTDDTICITGQTIANSIWTQYTCTFTTPSFHSGTPYIYIKSTGIVVRTFFLDLIQLSTGNTTSSYREGNIALNGIINSPTVFQNQADSTTAFQIQNSNGGGLFQVDATNSNVTINGNNSGIIQPWQIGNASSLSAIALQSTVIANGYIYLIGGINAAGTAQSTAQYAKINANGNVGNWSTTTALPTTLTDASSAVYNGYIYVTGGSTANSNATAVDTVYYAKLNRDGTIGSWTNSANPINVSGSQKRWDHTSAAYNGYLYVIGGTNNSGTNQSTVYYSRLNADGSNGIWASASTLNGAMASHATAIANGYLYVIGGQAPTTTQYAKLNANGTTGGWSLATALPGSRTSAGIAIANGYIYVIAGSNNGATFYASTYFASLSSDGSIGSWNCQGSASDCSGVTQINATALPNTRYGFGSNALSVNGYFYVIGGGNSTAAATMYYTSTSRIQVNGSVDLVGTSSENLNEGGSGGTLTAGNTNIIGGLNVQESASILQGLSVGDDITVNGSALFKNGANSTTAFQVQNAAGINLLAVDTSGSIITIAGTSTTFANLTITNAHFKSTQTTAPTIGTPTNCGTTPTATSTTGSTDLAGSFIITTGTGGGTTCDTVITFNKAYGAAPKSVVLQPTTAVGSATGLKSAQVSATSTTTFTVKLLANPAAAEVNGFYFWVVE